MGRTYSNFSILFLKNGTRGNVFVRASMAGMKHEEQKRAGAERVCLAPHHCSSLKKSGQELKQGRNPEAGIDAEATEEGYIPACSHSFVQPAFL